MYQFSKIKIPGFGGNIIKVFVVGLVNNPISSSKNTNLNNLKLGFRVLNLNPDYKNLTHYNQIYRTLNNPSSKESYERYFDVSKRNNIHFGVPSKQVKNFRDLEFFIKSLYSYDEQKAL